MAKQKQEVGTITMTYKQLSVSNLHQVLFKLNSAEVSAMAACRIRKVVMAIDPLLTQMSNEFKEKVQEPHTAKLKELGLELDAKGNYVAPADKPELTEQAKPLWDEFFKAQDAFGEKEVTLNVMPLAPQHLNEVKVSAREIEALGPLFDEEGTTREAQFRKQLGVVPSGPTPA